MHGAIYRKLALAIVAWHTAARDRSDSLISLCSAAAGRTERSRSPSQVAAADARAHSRCRPQALPVLLLSSRPCATMSMHDAFSVDGTPCCEVLLCLLLLPLELRGNSAYCQHAGGPTVYLRDSNHLCKRARGLTP